MKKWRIVIASVAALLLAAMVAVVVASRNRQQPAPPPEVPVVAAPGEVRVKAVERKAEPVEQGKAALASGAVAIVCGMDEATADRYEARNDALRSIARRRDLSKEDVAALLAYLRRTDDALRVERVAALKNDVMNLLRLQEPMPEELAETLEVKMENCGCVACAQATDTNLPLAQGGCLPGASNDGPGDALRHCIWSCMMSKRCGNLCAWLATAYHESFNPLPWDNRMDLANNSVGRDVAGSSIDCGEGCLKKFYSGELTYITLNPDDRIPLYDEALDCINRSRRP